MILQSQNDLPKKSLPRVANSEWKDRNHGWKKKYEVSIPPLVTQFEQPIFGTNSGRLALFERKDFKPLATILQVVTDCREATRKDCK